MKKAALLLLSAGLPASFNGFASVQAEDMPESPAVASQGAESTNAGNRICPVSGEKIDEKMKATYEYEGKTYNFCCTMCIEEFKKDPEKYIKKVREELGAGPKEEAGEGGPAWR